MRLLSPAALLANLEQRLRLLTGGPRDQPARQQALRDTIAWSDDLLSPHEQRLFHRLAVFVQRRDRQAIGHHHEIHRRQGGRERRHPTALARALESDARRPAACEPARLVRGSGRIRRELVIVVRVPAF